MKARGFQSHLYQGGSAFALMAAMQLASANAALAQQASQTAQSVAVEEIVVTGSRVIQNGLAAPTPVTVVSVEQLKNAVPGNIGVSISQLPQFRGSSTNQGRGPTTTGGNGVSSLALRGLGASRTLTLLNGQRIVPQGTAGTSDASLLPTALIQRIDVVTGGASAAYGSDAVSGVVNFILDTTYQGLKGQVEGGISSRGDHEYYKGELAFGTGFGGDRGRFVASAEYADEQGLDFTDRDFAVESWSVVSNPASTAATASPTNPVRVVARDVRASNASYGGLITNTILAGIQFGPGGVPGPFTFGTLRSATSMSGGDGPNVSFDSVILSPLTQKSVFGHGEYDVSDNLTAFLEGAWAYNNATYRTFPNFQNGNVAFTIFNGNAYLPASIQQVMTAKNIASFTMGRISPDFGDMGFINKNETVRFVGGLRGKFGDGWSFDSYAEWGRNVYNSITDTNANQKRLYRASDAVLDTATGSIVCRAKLLAPASTDPEIRDCVPINVFGVGSPSAAALNYVLGASVHQRRIKENVVSFSVRGEPFEGWAGPIALGFGAEYRKEEANGTSDAVTFQTISNLENDGTALRSLPAALNGKAGGYDRTNNRPVIGSYNIKEGFIETLVPLVKDQGWAKAIDFNGAVRYADYNLSGGVVTWKVGAVYQPIDDLRFRATRSRDIRAGNLTELFTQVNITQSTIIDRFRNNASSNINTEASGNPNLEPEKADTTAVGMTYQPAGLPGFGASIDYYDISIKEAIGSIGAQLTIDQCFAGAADLCPLIIRDPGSNLILRILTRQLNINKQQRSGLDFEVNYRTPLTDIVEDWEGDLSVRLIANYDLKGVTQNPGAPVQIAKKGEGYIRATLTANYDNGPVSVFLRERYISAGKYNTTFTTSDLDNNHVPARFYTDVTARYRLGEESNTEIFATISNLFDKRPPNFGDFFVGGTRVEGSGVYDFVLRNFVVGLRFAH